MVRRACVGRNQWLHRDFLFYQANERLLGRSQAPDFFSFSVSQGQTVKLLGQAPRSIAVAGIQG